MGEIVKPEQFHKRATPDLIAHEAVKKAVKGKDAVRRRAILEAIKDRVEGLLNG